MHKVSSNYAPVDGGKSNISVFIRGRPLEDPGDSSDFIEVDQEDSRKIVIKDPDATNRRYGEVSFQFDKVFWTQTEQGEIFDNICKTHVEHVLNGYNTCCFAYGQTGSGKTYTMFGADGDSRGIIPRSVEYLFQATSKRSSSTEIAMVCSFLEIYNDQIRDLGKAYLVAMGVESSNSSALYEKTSNIFENLAGKRGNPYFAPAFHRPGSAAATSAENRPGIKEIQDEYNTMNYEIREDNEGNVFVKDLSLVPVTTMEEVISLINMGLRVRATHETKMNAVSSRSHTVFTITVLQRDKISGVATTGMLNLVDLAGSERLKKSESQGIRLKEALHINTSLTALGKVIMALDPSSENTHIPYRDSKLTRVLQNSLGGNSYTSVIAAVHPSPRYHEECLSTLQFANRCRNVRNNPKVNYVEESDDKEKKIKKLTEELTAMRAKLNQTMSGGGGSGGGAGGGGKGGEGSSVPANKLVNILKAMGISASLAADGAIVVNGKKYASEDLGMDGGGSVGDGGMTASYDGGRTGGKDSNAGSNVEKLQKIIKELKESNETYSMRAKERKTQVEEQARELQRLSSELVKCRTMLKHKEFEYTTLQEDKERSIAELKALMESRHREEIDGILKSNEGLLREQQAERDKIPEAVLEYTKLVGKFEKQRVAIEAPLKAEFEEHLNHLDKTRNHELDNIRKQYEHFLDEKDRALSGFVDAFNLYRAKKSEQLRMAEREIVRLYDYTEQIETILDNVEKGKYQVKQKQGAKGGKSTTGIVTTLGMSGTGEGADRNQAEEGTIGAVVLPKGVRPVNPLKMTEVSKDNGLDLTKRIVAKHKDRVAKLEKMKEDAFQKSLHYAAQTGATATGNMDSVLKQQVRDLLVSKPNVIKRPSSPTNKKSKLDAGLNETGENQTGSSKSNLRPLTGEMPRKVSLSNDELRSGNATAPGGLQGRPGLGQDSKPSSSDRTTMWSRGNPQREFTDELLKELEELRNQARMEKITTDRVLNEFASNETFQYIQRLEADIEKLRKQLRDVTAQLMQAKTANASLSRTAEKNKRFNPPLSNDF